MRHQALTGKCIGAVILGSLLVAGSVVFADDEGPHDRAIKARQGMYQLYGFNFALLSAMAKEKMPYDANLATAAASNLDAVVNLDQSQLWPVGSDNAAEGNAPTRALPALWDNIDDAIAKSEKMTAVSAELLAVAGNGLGELQAVVGDVGGACKACHDDYRAKKK